MPFPMMNRRLIFEMEFFTMYSRTYIVSPTRFHEKELQTQPLSLSIFVQSVCLCVSCRHLHPPPAGWPLCYIFLYPLLIIYLPKQNNPATKNTMHACKTSKPFAEQPFPNIQTLPHHLV